MAALVQLERVTIRYPGQSVPVLAEFSFTLSGSELVVLFGASGVGKSTLLRAIAGLQSPASGTIGYPETGGAPPRMGFVFQEDRLFPWRRVVGNVELGLEAPRAGLDRAARRRSAEALLHRVGLGHLGGRWPRELSGGQRQRVGIARALAVEPRLLLMDEPFSSLDYLVRRGLQDEVLRLWSGEQIPVVFVTHDIEEAIRLADRIIVLGGGPPAYAFAELRVELSRPRIPDDPAFEHVATRLRGLLAASVGASDPGL